MIKRITILVFSLQLTGLCVQAQTPLSRQVAATVMRLWKDSFSLTPGKPAKWSYDQGVFLKGFEGIWKATGDAAYFSYIQKSMDFFVNGQGDVHAYKPDEFNIDHINNARILLLLHRVTGKEKYWKAASQMRDQLRSHPRTSEGGFWHKKVYPHQMWLDGLYMGEPFYAEYSYLTRDDTAYNDIARQFILMEKHARDPKTGLLYHGWDESKQQKWADKIKGTSPNFWARSIGWYAMALVDVLDYFPVHHPQYKELVAILNRLSQAIQKVQHPASGLWYQVIDQPNVKGNYPESSASSMFVYALAKGVRKGYLASKDLAAAKKAYAGIEKEFIVYNADGSADLKGTVTVSGLGGNPYRDGSVEYYLSEKVITNDPKGMGAFLQAAVEMEMLPTLANGKGKTILLDNYYNRETKKDVTGNVAAWHYVWNELDNNGYSLLGDIFIRHGASLLTLTEKPSAAHLKNASIYIIADPDTEKESSKPNYMQPEDAAAIAGWVKAGGVLALFLNDSMNAEFSHFNILPEKFGIHFNQDAVNKVTGQQFDMGAIEIAPGNYVFRNARKVYIKELATLTVSPPAKALVKHKGDVIAAVAAYGKGWVFAVGDPWFYNEYTDGRKLPGDFQNYTAAADFVQWILNRAK